MKNAPIEKQLEIGMTPPDDSNGGVIIGNGGISVTPALTNAPEETTASTETTAAADNETVENEIVDNDNVDIDGTG